MQGNDWDAIQQSARQLGAVWAKHTGRTATPTRFDGGPREPAAQSRDAEQAHRELVFGLMRPNGRT